MNVIRIKEYVYNADIRIVINCSPARYSAYVKQCFGQSHLPPKDGHFVVFDNGQHVVYLIRMRDFDWRIQEYALLAHEIFHCVHRVLSDLGASLTDQSEELYANYFQYLYSEAISKIKDKLK